MFKDGATALLAVLGGGGVLISAIVGATYWLFKLFSEKWLCGLAQAMDRRAHHRMAQSLPPLGQGLGVPQPKGLGVLAPCLNPPHAQKALSKNSMIPDRL
jgi:hypothetical protein